MKKELIIGIVIVGVIGLGALAYWGKGGGGGKQVSKDCVLTCQKAVETCPSLINKEVCEQNCDNLSQETKDHLNQANSCQELTQKPELIAELLIPEVKTPEKIDAKTDCEGACSNYTMKCLSLVPNADQNLYNEGLMSCMSECSGWKSEKVGCMLNAQSCPAMTEVCGL
ncbi:MAG: hypothetical protein WC531_00480 [Candidatus Paceibacterota bacterium]|jgi:hypothetical protein